MLAAISCYALYQVQHSQRYQSYAQSVLHGSFELISLGLTRHTGVKRRQWLKIASKLMATELTLNTYTNANTPLQPTTKASMGLNVQLDKNQRIQATLITPNQGRLSAKIDYIGEQHYRMIAVLLLNELGRVPSSDQPDLINQLAKLPLPPLTLSPIDSLSLDQQQMSRIKRADIVVNQRQDQAGSPSWIYARLPKSQTVLVIGPIDDFQDMPTSLIIMMLALSIFITAIVAYYLVYGLEQRLARIDASVQSFAQGQGHDPVAIQGEDAISKLAGTINHMALRIGNLLNEQKEIGQAISHELRTPISRMKFRLQALSDQEPSEPQLTKIMGLKKDVNEIDSLINEILSLQQSEYKQQQNTIDIKKMLDELLTLHALQFPTIAFILHVNTPFNTVYADAHLLKRALQNLIQNGFKHAETCLNIHISLHNYQLKIEIMDDGAGIEDKNKAYIFTPFIRLDSSRNKKTGGFGLGLTIVKRICDAHDINIWVEDSPQHGANFCLLFPVTDLPRENS